MAGASYSWFREMDYCRHPPRLAFFKKYRSMIPFLNLIIQNLMYLYDYVTNLYYLDVMTPQTAFFTNLAFQAQMTGNGLLEPQLQNLQQKEKLNLEEASSDDKTRKAALPKKKLSKHSHKKNIRNIIPNIARKILSFICSQDSRQTLEQCFPDMTVPEIQEYYKFAQHQKSSLSFYIGNKDLTRIWYDPKANQQFLKIARVLSKQFLQNDCVNSILLSRRMKPCLKIEHLRYRHRIMRILYSGPKCRAQ